MKAKKTTKTELIKMTHEEYKTVIDLAQADVLKQAQEIFSWLLGESGEFPQRKEGQGAYYWRSELGKKLKKAGIR